jgi:hypothetical protein
LRAEIRELVVALRAAAARRDWDAMSWAFPNGQPLTVRIHDVVAGGPDGGGLSFWAADARPDVDQLLVAPLDEGLVAISIPFTHRSSTGTFGAVFEKHAGMWRMRCFQETFPDQGPVAGCMPKDHPS